MLCSSSEPYGICRSWPAELWVKVKQAELRSAKRRIDLAQPHLAGVQAGSGPGQISLPRIEDELSVTPDSVLSYAHLPDLVAKEAYHLPY